MYMYTLNINYLSGAEWLTAVDALETKDAWLPRNLTWTGCHGSEARYRGYPCGVWTLFHVLTVNSRLLTLEIGPGMSNATTCTCMRTCR